MGTGCVKLIPAVAEVIVLDNFSLLQSKLRWFYSYKVIHAFCQTVVYPEFGRGQLRKLLFWPFAIDFSSMRGRYLLRVLDVTLATHFAAVVAHIIALDRRSRVC